MLKTLTLAVVLASAVAAVASVPANAASGRTTPAQCQALYDKSRLDSNSDRTNRDAYIECVGRL